MVSIVIPTLFPSPALREYLSKLVGYKSVKEVIVVVNDREVPSAKSQVPSTLRTIYTGKNLGFTVACNAGAKVAVGDLIANPTR